MDAPAWLIDEPEISALLHAVLDRFDQQPAAQRARPLFMSVAQHLPSLARNDAAADHSWAFVCSLERDRVLAIRRARRSPYDAAWSGAKLSFSSGCESLLREWLVRPAMSAPSVLWRAAVEKYAHRFPGDPYALLARRIVIAGRSAEDIVAALASLDEVTGAATLRQLSVSAFWGDSKLLDDRAELIAALHPQLTIRDRPVVVTLHLPASIAGILFIENQDTYTAAIAGQPADASGHALVYIAGFRGAAVRIRSPEGASLHFRGPGAAALSAGFERQWFDLPAFGMPLFFWGDLDFAGMQILRALRARFGNVQAWQPGYAPMLKDLITRGGRPFDADARGQADPGVTGCLFADEVLLAAIRQHGFRDQERLAGAH